MKFFLLCVVCLGATAEASVTLGVPNVEMIQKVARGEVRRAKASWWGFDPQDSTRFLQAALDSKVPELIVDRMSSPWVVTPLEVRSNQTVSFEEGVVLEAKRGAFREVNSALVRLGGSKNVTLRGLGKGTTFKMHKRDYLKPPYEKSEWRHALSICSAEKVTVENIRLESSGGDGIYLGSWSGPCRDVVIRNCVCDDNCRQGISVISVSGLLLENTVMSNTWGVAPEAGIDFEPNKPDEVLENIVVRNCRTENNASSGVEFYFQCFNADTKPISIRFEDCVFSGDKNGFCLCGALGKSDSDMPCGEVKMTNCRIEKAKYVALSVTGKPDRTVALLMDGCEFVDNGTAAPDTNDVVFTSLEGYNKPTDAVIFGNLTIRQPRRREWFRANMSDRATAGVDWVMGEVTVIGPDGVAKREHVNEFWRTKRFSQKVCEPTLNSVRPDFSRTEADDAVPGKSVSFEPVQLRRKARYLVRADRDGAKVSMVAHLTVLGRKNVRHFPVSAVVKGYEDGRMVCRVPELGFDKDTEIAFVAPKAGFYLLEADAGGKYSFALAASDTPVAILHDRVMPSFLASAGRLSFYVPERDRFALLFGGGDRGAPGSWGERVRAKVLSPIGEQAWSCDDIMGFERYQLPGPAPKGGYWTVERMAPTHGTFDDNKLGLMGVPGVLFLSDMKRWTIRPEPPPPPATVMVDPTVVTGPVKPVNGVGQPPMVGGPPAYPMIAYLQEAGIPYSRLHDVGGLFGENMYVDIPNVFRDFDADEEDPKSYDFAMTDKLLQALVDNGVEPYYRLGVTIENYAAIKSYRIDPPKDPAKWARICEHVIRHYTEGWADGFRMKIRYWEIWNEPENSDNPATNPMWRGDWKSFMDFYGIVSRHLKERFPHLKIGGYGSCGFRGVRDSVAHLRTDVHPGWAYKAHCISNFLVRAKAESWPLDFFSFHSYDDTAEALRQVSAARRTLDDFGFRATELSFNEWLPLQKPRRETRGTALQAARIAAELIGLQNGPCDTAMIYDAKCGGGDYSPLFDPTSEKPRKAYYAFLAFNELRKLGTAVKCRVANPSVYATAAVRADRIAVMVANIGDSALPFSIEGIRLQSSLFRVTDENRTDEATDSLVVLPAHAFLVAVGALVD